MVVEIVSRAKGASVPCRSFIFSVLGDDNKGYKVITIGGITRPPRIFVGDLVTACSARTGTVGIVRVLERQRASGIFYERSVRCGTRVVLSSKLSVMERVVVGYRCFRFPRSSRVRIIR